MSEIAKEKSTAQAQHVMQPQLQHKPFVFRDFAAREEPPPPPPPNPVDELPPPAPGFNEEELLAAQKEAEAMGRAKGREDAKREWDEMAIARETQIIALLESLLGRMEAELQSNRTTQDAMRGDMANIVLMIARKLVGNALDAQPLGAVETMVDECLTMLAGEAKLSIAVAKELEEPLRAWMERLPRMDRPVIDVIGDVRMQPGDCRIQWPGGKAERNQEALMKEMEAIVMRTMTGKETQ